MAQSSLTSFETRARKALQDAQLQKALKSVTHRFISHREHAFSLLPDPQGLKQRGRAIRERTIAHLADYLVQLEAAVSAHGGSVHWAEDGAEACRIVIQLLQGRGARRIVKSKSMISEEIGLNHALSAAGMEVIETDLGEWIVQLAGEPPSHIVAPAMHKSKEQVAELFARHVGQPVSADIPALTQLARRELRQAFLTADAGISGVNFAVAETGTLVLVTNEGNGRLVTSLPRLHIALMGLEKVAPTWEDLSVLLPLLTRSATGQLLTSYVTCITGPRRPGEADGPEELHLILVDNGRTRILENEYREALYCIRCGACSNICPVYYAIGGHAYGGVYSGPIGAVLTPLYQGRERFGALPHASSLCGACKEVCPVQIDLPRMLLALRAQEVEEKSTPWWESLLFRLYAWGTTHPRLYRLGARIGALVLRPLARNGWIREVSLPIINRWTAGRDLPAPAVQPFHARWRALAREGVEKPS